MNYSETIKWLYQQLPMFQRDGAAAYKADLNKTIAILKAIDNPQEGFKVIHVAGTNGKGSVSHFIASVLQESGYKTGLYTSPHLKDFRERIRINGKMIPEKDVVNFIEKNKDEIKNISPSFFEITVAMAYEYFKNENVDFAILETGMGGRLDSTNISNPILSIITNIGYDHTRFLGNTLEKIAYEKAGIIKDGIPVVIGRKQKETLPVFETVAGNKNTRLYFAEDHFELKQIHTPSSFIKHYDIWKDDLLYIENIESPLGGDYQAENIATALQALDVLKESKIISTGINEIKEGIENTVDNTGIKGRWQVLNTNPVTIADTGHNEDGIRSNVTQLLQMDFNHLHIVLGIVSDKDYDGILSLLPGSATYYFCKADIPRAMDAEELKNKAEDFGLNGNFYPSVTHAYSSAINNAGANDLVFVGGSTFVVAEII